MCLDIFLKNLRDALLLNHGTVSASPSTSRFSQVSIKNLKCTFKRGGFHRSNSWMHLSRTFTIKESYAKDSKVRSRVLLKLTNN
jgi:hypothetical protein